MLGSDYKERMFSTNTQYTYHLFEEKGQYYYLFTEFDPYEGKIKLLKSNAKRSEELGRQLVKLEEIKKEFLFIEEIKKHPSVRLKWLFKEK